MEVKNKKEKDLNRTKADQEKNESWKYGKCRENCQKNKKLKQVWS